jgi:hypothetical protein
MSIFLAMANSLSFLAWNAKNPVRTIAPNTKISMDFLNDLFI